MKKELVAIDFTLNSNPEKRQSLIASFHRRFRMKHCLAEMPSKTFYTWRDEGLIHSSFGKRKDNLFEEEYGTPQGGPYERYNVYELIWIRLIYHLRSINYPKEILSKAAEQYFIQPSIEVNNAITTKGMLLTNEIMEYAKILGKNLDKKRLEHELDKLLVALAESMVTTEYHKCVYIALTTPKDLYFIVNNSGIKCVQEEVGGYQSITETLTRECSSPITVIKFSMLFKDLIQVSETDFIKRLIRANEDQGLIIDEWKSSLVPFEQYRASPKSLPPTKDYFLNIKNSYE